MEHSYCMTSNIYGQPILGGNALKTRNGEKTSEALFLQESIDLFSRLNIRNLYSMKKNDEEKQELKKIKAIVKSENSFKGELVYHFRAS